MPLLRVGFHKIVGWRAGRAADIAGVDEHTNDHRNFLLGNQVVDDIQRRIIAVALNTSAAILKYHQPGGDLRVVFRRDVDPILTLHPVIDFAGMDKLFQQCAGWDAWLQVRKWSESRHAMTAAEYRAIDRVVEGVQ